jgi:hypothetical protein
MLKVTIGLAALALVATSASGRQYKDKDIVSVDPAMSYVVIRSGYANGIELLRQVDASDRATWENIRQNDYDKARKKYERALKNYETDIKAWNGGDAMERKMIGTKPKKPAEVTLESTPILPIEFSNFVTVARKPAVAEDSSGMRTYIVEVKPGTYYLYGAPNVMGAIGVGTCFCMGTVGFTVRPGQIVDAGTVTAPPKDFFAPPTYTPASANPLSLPQLGGRKVDPAALVAVGKMANFRSTPITRLNAVPGVLAYDRDIPLDVANGNRPIPAIR